LFGATDSFSGDKVMQVTLAFNHFGKGLVQRMPRCRWGFFHIVNNDYTHWLMYAVGGSQQPTIISQGNRFVAPEDINAKEVCNVTCSYDKLSNKTIHNFFFSIINKVVAHDIYTQVTKRTQATKEVWKDWNWRSEGDLFVNGAYFVESGKKVTATPKTDVIAQSAKSVAILTQDAGPIKCVVNKPC